MNSAHTPEIYRTESETALNPANVIQQAKDVMLNFGNGHADGLAKDGMLDRVRELTDQDLHKVSNPDDQAFVSYARLGIEPQDAKDLDNNVFKGWFDSQEEYDGWLGNYALASQSSQNGFIDVTGNSNLKMDSASNEEVNEPSSRLRSKLLNAGIVAGAGIALFVEQSPINEALRTNAGLEVLENTQSALAVGATVAAITVVIEAVPSAFISLGLHREGGAVQKLKTKLAKKEQEEAQLEKEVESEEQNLSEKSKVSKLADAGADVGIALGLGAGLVTVKKHIQDPNPSLAKDLKTSAKATGIVAGVSGLIGYLAGGGIQNAEKVGLETPAEYVIDYGTDTKFWMGVLGVGYTGYFIKKGIDRIRSDRSNEDLVERVGQ